MNYGFDDYEAAILKALASLKVENGSYLKTLKGYAGELDEDAALDNFLRGFPGVLVEVSEADYSVLDIVQDYQETRVNLLVGARSFRSQDQARGGDAGAFTILKDLRRLLNRKDLGLEIRPLQIRKETKLASSPKTVIYLAEYVIINDSVTEEV
jgi:phage gp37-like protein